MAKGKASFEKYNWNSAVCGSKVSYVGLLSEGNLKLFT